MKISMLFVFVTLALLLPIGAPAQKKLSQHKPVCGDLMTQGEMNRCAQDEYRKADAELNKVYQQVMAKLTPEHKAKLKTAQLAWIQFRDAHCECEAFTFDGGSMQPLIRFTCLDSETQHRINQLKSLAEDVSR
ncbi:MAG: lysozyme inhibitor LprI family protein [Blastocatellales bacterium]